MKKVLTAGVLMLLMTLTIQAQEIKSGSIGFSSEKKSTASTSEEVTGTIDLSTKAVNIEVGIAGFTFKKQMQKDHFDGETGMNIAEHAKATFVGAIEGDADLSAEGTHEITVAGKLTILGVESDFSSPGKVMVAADGVTVTAEFKFDRAAHKVETKYAKMMDEEVAMTFEAKL